MAAARAARDAGEADRALALAQEARSRAPDAPEPAFLLCALLLARRHPAANALLGTLSAFGGFAPGWEELGHALLAQQPAAARVAFGRAADAYRAMEAQTPTAAVAYRLGTALRHAGRLPKAREAVQRATARDPSAPQAWFSLGLLCQDLHDHPGSVEAFRAALAARPDFHEAAFNLGVAYQEGGDLHAALDAYALAWRLRPDAFGRIAQALASPGVGRLWLHPSALRRDLAARA